MITLRAPGVSELAPLTDLILRSKAYWGYDAAFIQACEDELRLDPRDLCLDAIIVAASGVNLMGMAPVSFDSTTADLDKLFVDPSAMGQGVGRDLFDWVVARCRTAGVHALTIEADPNAVPFYRRMGAVDAGSVASVSIPGRVLPRLTLDLR